MLNIKYKGKDKITKKWVYGYCYEYDLQLKIKILIFNNKIKKYQWQIFDIIENTLSQLVVIISNANQELYTGDIIKIKLKYYDDNNKKYLIGTISYNEEQLCYGIDTEQFGFWSFNELKKLGDWTTIKLVGNIFDKK